MASPPQSLGALLRSSLDDPASQRALEALLTRMAHRALRGERQHSLETSDLAHEVYLRLAADGARDFEDPGHLRRFVARVTRNVLVDRARRRKAEKRGGQQVRVTYHEAEHVSGQLQLDVLALHQALERLHAVDPRAAEVVALRAFGGATAEETAESLGISRATVQAEWAFALTWMRKALSEARDRDRGSEPDR